MLLMRLEPEQHGCVSLFRCTCSCGQGTDSDCSEELVEAIVALARVIGGPASGITNEEAVEAARFRDDLKIQKCELAGWVAQWCSLLDGLHMFDHAPCMSWAGKTPNP